jgi:hypothetical protein
MKKINSGFVIVQLKRTYHPTSFSKHQNEYMSREQFHYLFCVVVKQSVNLREEHQLYVLKHSAQKILGPNRDEVSV